MQVLEIYFKIFDLKVILILIRKLININNKKTSKKAEIP